MKPANTNEHLQKELVNQLYQRFSTILNGDSAGTLVFITIFWDVISHVPLLIWLVISITCNLVARVLTYSYFQHQRSGTLGDIKKWQNFFTLSVASGGFVWGLAGCLFIYTSNDAHLMYIIIVLMASVSVINAELFHAKIIYVVFVSPIYASLIFLLVSQQEPIFHYLLMITVLFMILSTIYSFNLSNTLKKSVSLQAKNTELYFTLMEAKQQLENINHKLRHEIRTRHKAEKALQELATHDSLTGLANRHLLNSKLKDAITQAQRDCTFVAVILVDLDHFKHINDTLGHTIGDKLLVNVAQRLRSTVRACDTVARFGGDEFCVVLPAITDTSVVQTIASKIFTELQKLNDIDKHQFFISTSIGISIYPIDADDIKLLIKKADLALYHVKNSGRGSYRFFSDALNVGITKNKTENTRAPTQ